MFNYYETQPQHIFNEMKRLAIEIWSEYDNEFWYVDEKVNRIKDIKNIKDNIWFMYRMFDYENQQKLYNKWSTPLKALLQEYELYIRSLQSI